MVGIMESFYLIAACLQHISCFQEIIQSQTVEVTQCLQGVMRGAGDTMAPMWLSMITTVVIRVPLAYLMTGMTESAENPHGEFYMMFVSLLITWLIGATLTTIVYKAGRWKRKALI